MAMNNVTEVIAALVFGRLSDKLGADYPTTPSVLQSFDQTLIKARRHGLDHRDAMSRQDAHTFFQSIGQSVIPGPTGTNVNDFRAILIEP